MTTAARGTANEHRTDDDIQAARCRASRSSRNERDYHRGRATCGALPGLPPPSSREVRMVWRRYGSSGARTASVPRVSARSPNSLILAAASNSEVAQSVNVRPAALAARCIRLLSGSLTRPSIIGRLAWPVLGLPVRGTTWFLGSREFDDRTFAA